MSYGAPSPVAVDAVLASGYTPPSATAVDGVLSRVGPDYGAPLPTAVNAVLASGYTPPAATSLAAILIRTLPPGTMYPTGIDDGAFGTAELSLRTLGPSGIAPGGFGTAGVFTTQIVTASGWQSSTFGTTFLELKDRYYALTGWQSSAFGTAFVELNTRFVLPSSWQSSTFGASLISQRNRTLEVGGIAPPPLTGPDGDRQMPTPTIDYRTKTLVPAGIPAGTIPAHYIADYYQFIDLAGTGSSSEEVGTHQIADRIRYIEPPFIASTIFGTALIARIQEVTPLGWSSSVVSIGHQLDINLQRLQHHSVGTDPARYGATSVHNTFETLRPTGIPEGGVNYHVVFNRTQVIRAGAYEDTTGDPTIWPRYYPFVENRNRTIRPSGWASSRFSAIGQWIRNKAVAIRPTGLDATIWGTADIGHYIRYIPVASIYESYITTYNHVRNTAQVLASVGAGDTSVFGVAALANRNRTYVVTPVTSSLALGTAFVAYRIRSVEAYRASDPPYVPIPEVRHNPYRIAPLSLPEQRSSAHTVYEHFNRFFPSSANVASVPRIGVVTIANRNRVLRVAPSDQSTYGRTRIENRIRYLTDVSLGRQVLFGRADISRRTKVLTPASATVPVFTVLHRIRNVIPDPPVPQRVFVDGIFIGAYDFPGILPAPRVAPYYVRVPGINQSGFGTPVLTRNQISVGRGIFTLDQVGVPSFSGTQFCYPESLRGSEIWGAIRLSPYTIYAPSADQATQQARDNHPLNNPHMIGELESVPPSWPVFGAVVIANRNRTIGPVPYHRVEENETLPALQTRYGTPDVQLRNRVVRAQGVRPGRFGFTAILGGTQFVDLSDPSVGIAPPLMGAMHQVGPPYEAPLPAFYPVGVVSLAVGTARVELLNRVLAPEGIRHRGNPEQDLTNPWGQAHVGPPVPIPIGGYVMTLWGTARVEHRIRTVQAKGFESLSLIDYTLNGFASRMRVRRVNPVIVAPSIAAPSLASPVVGHV